MPFAASSTFGEKGLKSSWKVPAAPVVIVSTLLEDVLLPLLALVPLLPQAASITAVTMAAPAAIVRTRQGLDDIAESLFLLPWILKWSWTSGTARERRSARNRRRHAASHSASCSVVRLRAGPVAPGKPGSSVSRLSEALYRLSVNHSPRNVKRD